MRQHAKWTLCVLAIALCTVAVSQLTALEPPQRPQALQDKVFKHPGLDVQTDSRRPADLPAAAAEAAGRDLAALGAPATNARVDLLSGRFSTVTPVQPLYPGNGVGNGLTWNGLGLDAPADRRALENAAGQLARDYLTARAAELRINPAELGSGKVTAYGDGDFMHVYLPRVVDGVSVEGAYLGMAVSHGNVVLLGTNRWGDVRVSRRPALSLDQALAAAREHVGQDFAGFWGRNELQLTPMTNPAGREIGQGLVHRLTWTVRPSFAGDQGSWQARVDGHTGEVLSFEDTNLYVATPRKVMGGVLPVSNDGVPPDGVEQAGWPMPFDNVSTPSGTVTTDAGGNLPNPVDGNITSNLSGQFISMNDNCGAISLTSAGDIDFGTSGGTDCTTPGFGGAGNTHASRTGFHELNRIKEMARGQLPGNNWLTQQLTSNMNINNTCNAFWNGSTVNFYRSGGGCFNTGEIAGVFDHEWGHGMDANDATPGIAAPSGEGIADAFTALRLNDDCIGRNFRATLCTGFGDACTECTGVRTVDHAKRASGQPQTVTWTNDNCGTSVHCRGLTYAQAVWSLWKRDLPSFYGMDDNTAHEVANRLTYVGSGGVGTWYTTTPPGGCNATSGYQNFLAADDDNGNLNDGTPHMQAIFSAFDRQEIACGTPAVQDSGCSDTPTAATTVTATPFDKSVNLSWTAVAGAGTYRVYRTDGVFACAFGKSLIAETAGTSFNDTGLQNGRAYSYVVIPMGSGDTCMGPASSCTTASPAAGPNADIDPASASLAIVSGDGDEFLDNCENATLSFDVSNTGLGSLTNVRVVSVTPSNPGTTINSAMPSAVSPSTLGPGGTGTGSFSLTAGGLSFNETLTFTVEFTADELAQSKTQDLSVSSTESDFVANASRTFSFESDLENWSVTGGTFGRSTAQGGATGSWAVASSNAQDGACDRIRTPLLRLTASSTLSLSSHFDIEPLSGGTWYDRANVGVVAGGSRTAVNPDSGRLYNADSGGPGNFGGCNEPEDGWGGLAASWASSGWSATALQSGAFAGQNVQLEIVYGTDGALANRGFSFDAVTLTDVEFQETDGQNDVCIACTSDNDCDDGNACNGAETCNLGTGACEAGTPLNCDDGQFCNGTETCDAGLGCQAGSDPCPGDSCDEGADVCGCGNGTCDAGEDCDSCAADCPSLPIPGSTCGNGICEAGDGEDCNNCAADCDGVTGGKPANRFCCGATEGCDVGGGACNSGGFMCTTTPTGGGGTACCGDLFCESPEDIGSCAIDCDTCGNGTCEANEDSCSCAADCGAPPATEAGSCADGADNDCDGFVDCADVDCAGDAACQVDCSTFTDKNSCNAEPACNWSNRDKVCLPV